MENVFIRENKEYKNDIDVMKNYVEQNTLYVSKMLKIPLDKAREQVLKQIKKCKTKKDPIVRYMEREENGDKFEKTTTLSNYIGESLNKGRVIVPSLTVYLPPEIKRSLHADFLEGNINARNIDKKKAAVYKAEGKPDLAKHFDAMQKTRKVQNNSLSGSYASASTILFNPSAHYSLTSMTATATSIANSMTESMVAGNKHYINPEAVFSHITHILTVVDLKAISDVIVKYALYIPTVDEVIKVIRRSSDLYWTNSEFNNRLREYLNAMSGVELAAITYVNDLFNFKEHNKTLARTMLSKMSLRVKGVSTNHLEDLNNLPFFIINAVHHICASDIKGMRVKYDDMVGTETLDYLASTGINMYNTILEYKDLLQAFFRTRSLPVNISKMKSMTRRDTVLSDTDSTCASYDTWAKWFVNDEVKIFTDEAIALSATVMAIVTQTIEHSLRQYTTNMNIPNERKGLITYKGEFFWKTMTPMSVSKHYYANVSIKEGSVFKEDELELKGSNLIASNIPEELQKVHRDMIIEMNNTVTSNELINVTKYVTMIADIERDIKDKINKGNIEIFKLSKVKEAKAYKLSAEASPYIHHLFWEQVLSEKYGDAGTPPYTTIKVPTTLSTKRKFNEYLDTILDPIVKNNLIQFRNKYRKDTMGTFNIPLVIAGENGLPTELISAIDMNRVIFDLCNPFYMVMENYGVYRKDGMTYTEMGY